ncbi:hypothetical protein CVS40_3661 [Lucilia cuprina]|nr:hypothetical protein CVS40_3661 [Lucilia cuprina]
MLCFKELHDDEQGMISISSSRKPEQQRLAIRRLIIFPDAIQMISHSTNSGYNQPKKDVNVLKG